MARIERKIGEVFTVKGRQIKVFKQNYRGIDKCFGCGYNCLNGACLAPLEVGECRGTDRKDKTNVIFVTPFVKL